MNSQDAHLQKSISNKTLQKHIDNSKVAPSYLLIDKDILKLRQIAVWFSGSYNKADIFWLTAKDGANTIQVKETEEFIERTSFAAIGEKKLFVICDAATMTIAAQNKILKTIEDAAAGTCFMLLASSADTILNTIKSRCVTIYPDPLPLSLTAEELYKENKDSKQIFSNTEKLLLSARTLDDALSLIPLLIKKENFPLTLSALDFHLKTLLAENNGNNARFTIQKINAILKKLAIINRNVAANCNAQNAFDALLMEIFL